MIRYRKIAVAAIGLSSLGLFGITEVHGQPLGLMSPQAQKVSQQVLSCAGGRFVFGQISDSSKDQFMLDTVTGRLWRIAESGEVGTFLREVPYRTTQGKYAPVPGDIEEPETKDTDKK